MTEPGVSLVRALERITSILEERPQDVTGTIYVSGQQPFGDLVQALGHHRRNRFVQLRQLAMMFAADGPLERLSTVNGWLADLQRARVEFQSAFAALNCIRYFASEVPVQLGDHVTLRVLFRRREGRVTYLPGVTSPRSQIDFGGLFRVGVTTPRGWFIGCHVDPDSLDLKKGIALVRRDSSPTPAVPSDRALNE